MVVLQTAQQVAEMELLIPVVEVAVVVRVAELAEQVALALSLFVISQDHLLHMAPCTSMLPTPPVLTWRSTM